MMLISNSANGRKRRYLLILNRSLASICVLRSLVMAVHMSNTSSKRLGAAYRLRAVDLDSWSMELAKKVMNPCICM
jgi:hypothetical protein